MTAKSSLKADDVAVWWMPTADVTASQVDSWLNNLDVGERDRAARFHVARDRRDFVAAHMLLRSMLSSYADASPHEWRFTQEAGGKPRIDPAQAIGQQPRLSFNLSHTDGLVAACVSCCRREGDDWLGIDVERIDSEKADFSIVDTYFAPTEQRMLGALKGEDRIACFFRLWTLKEAYIKALGTGLDMKLDSFAFTFGSRCDPVVFFPGETDRGGTWRFATLTTTDSHVLSVAVKTQFGGNGEITPRAIAPEHLQV